MTTVVLSFFTAFLTTYFAIPSIIKIAKIKHLYDEPGHRKSHTAKTPTLGGLAIFAGLILSFSFWTATDYDPTHQYIIASMIILFFIGIKDDIFPLMPLKKFIGQILSACIIVFFADFRITNMYGILGINELPYFYSAGLTLFTILVLINAYNLVDGIDGLAGGIGFLCSLTFACWFWILDNTSYAILSFSLAGSLLAFLRFNFSPAKIFMGDTGSLLVGFLLSVIAINFITTAQESNMFMQEQTAPIVAIAILIIPLFDLLRVFIVRLLRKKSPFHADKNHMHHCLLRIGYNHKKSSIIMYVVNTIFIILSYFLKNMDVNLMLIVVIVLAFVFSQIPSIIKSQKRIIPINAGKDLNMGTIG